MTASKTYTVEENEITDFFNAIKGLMTNITVLEKAVKLPQEEKMFMLGQLHGYMHDSKKELTDIYTKMLGHSQKD